MSGFCFLKVDFSFDVSDPRFTQKKCHLLKNKMLLRMKKAVFTLGSINLVAMEKN